MDVMSSEKSRLLCILIFCVSFGFFGRDNAKGMDSQARHKTMFGTAIWGRNCTGQPHWLDGSIFPGVDYQSSLNKMLYMPLDPDGRLAVVSYDNEDIKNSNYDCALLSYWYDQIRQMQEAGLDWIAFDSFGDRYDRDLPGVAKDPRQSAYVIPSIVKAIRDTGAAMKICILDDAPSHTLYNYRYKLLRKKYPGVNKDGAPEWVKYRWDYESEPIVPIPVDEEFGRNFLAEKWIADYGYMKDAKDLWLTHNNASPEKGGRPVVLMYGTGPTSTEKATYSNFHIAFAAAKDEFKRRYGVEPFLILDMVYFTLDPKVDTVADGKWAWAPIAGKVVRPSKTVFTNPKTGETCRFSMVMPGFELMNKKLNHTAERRRWIAMDGSEGDEKHLLTTEFNLAMSAPAPDFMLIGHWNDFAEGQNFGRAIYPTKSGKGILPPDYYLKALRKLIDASRNTPKTEAVVNK